MANLQKILGLCVCAVLLLGCEKPDQHPIIGTFVGNSENTFGLVLSELRFEDDGTFVWTRTYVGLKEIMEERNPDHEWGDIGLEIIGEYSITNDEIILSPEESNQLYGADDVGEPMFPVFKAGEKYFHTYYFEGTDLILLSDASEEIVFKRK